MIAQQFTDILSCTSTWCHDSPVSSSHAITRVLVCELCGPVGWLGKWSCGHDLASNTPEAKAERAVGPGNLPFLRRTNPSCGCEITLLWSVLAGRNFRHGFLVHSHHLRFAAFRMKARTFDRRSTLNCVQSTENDQSRIEFESTTSCKFSCA